MKNQIFIIAASLYTLAWAMEQSNKPKPINTLFQIKTVDGNIKSFPVSTNTMQTDSNQESEALINALIKDHSSTQERKNTPNNDTKLFKIHRAKL
jgi:hypothetical protein